jgi:hypothetical protein
MECFRSSIYSVLMFDLANHAAIFVVLFAKISDSAPHVLTGATLDDQIRLRLGHLRRCGETAGGRGDRFLRCLNCATTIRGGHAPAVSIAANAACPISIHMPLALMN